MSSLPPCLLAFDKDTQDTRNRTLLEWLSDDRDRATLFRHIGSHCSRGLEFPSRDSALPDYDGADLLRRPPAPAVFGHTTVTLVTRREEIERILKDPKRYSSRVYAGLGGGSFMLALDPASQFTHDLQRSAFAACFPSGDAINLELAHAACEAAAVTHLRRPDFDLADFAEQAALRYCQLVMGYAASDYRALETTLRVAYRALVHQVFGRHFVTDRVLIPAAKVEMGKLLTRTAALIDAYASDDEDELRGTDDPARPSSFQPALQLLGQLKSPLNGEQRAIVALGAAIGTVGNVQAAVCIAVKALFADQTLLEQVRTMALRGNRSCPTSRFDEWKELLAGPLRANPPIPYLPRVEIDRNGNGRELLLALGGGTAGCPGKRDDPLLWGPDPAQENSHWCVGQPLAWPLIVEIVRTVMALPDLEQALDPVDGSVKGLEKRHGFACVSYPLTYRRDRRHAQSSLNVAMRIKSPVRENAERLRSVIRTGAPRIERTLRDSRHVHFAWFEFIEGDSVLVLHTVYDGPFDAYLQHFAIDAGALFDLIFECIEDPPPMPVEKFPTEFAAHLLRYDRKPALGYFFSAYPDSEVARILRNELRKP